MNGKSRSPPSWFHIEDGHRRNETSHSTILILCTLQKHAVEPFSPAYDWKQWWKMRGIPSKTPKQSISTPCRKSISVLVYVLEVRMESIISQHAFVLFLFVSFRALFVLHFWNLTSELLRRNNLHFPFSSHGFVPTGSPNRCRIFLFNAFSNDSFLKWLKHYL